MATPCEEEAMEVEPKPGESMQTSDLNVIINGENNEYITRNIFGTIFFKKTVKSRFFSLYRFFSLFKKSHYLAVVVIIVVIVVVI